MGTDSMTLGPGSFYMDDKLLGKAIDILEKVNVPYDDFEFGDSPAVTLSKAIEFELNSEFNIPVFNELVGELSKPQPFYMEYDGVRYEQIRKHKKKRINKKWAKRYGYREVPCRYRLENCYINQRLFNDFEIVSDPPKIVRYG